MSKVKTPTAFEEKLTAASAWRKRELAIAITTLQRFERDGVKYFVHARATVLLIYAHWEGFIKEASLLYIAYINSRKVPFRDLSDNVLASAIKSRLTHTENSGQARDFREFTSFMRGDLADIAYLSKKLIKTESNLSSQLFINIVEILGLEVHQKYLSRANLIDQTLLASRNCIAHGERHQLMENVDDVVDLRDKVLDLMQIFSNDISNSVAGGYFLKESERKLYIANVWQ